ncbi:MAG: hypothetical protein Q4G27_01985 [Flavobacteriaceae bacterium]|nr:hypothetical protein [Flavobacteriaceae bacterium]
MLLISAKAQVMIGDGLKIEKGTSFVIKNQDIIIDTEEIKGEGKLVISNDNNQKITVNQAVQSKVEIEILSEKIQWNGSKSENLAKLFSPDLNRVEPLLVQDIKNEELPVIYINTEGIVYDIEDSETQLAVYNSLPNDVHHGFIITEIMQSYAIEFYPYYNLPIYSFTLNDKRFLDYAELYEFQSLTAVFRPPII